MAGLIKREDIDEVRQRTDIKEIVDGYVTLKSAGVGSYKGLCPFHDERSPSFHVRPQMGSYHCFGCGEGGDVISFVQKMDHTSFSETVEKLASRIGFELRYEDGGTGPRREDIGRRQRMLDAHKIAAEFYRDQLLTQGAAAGRRFLQDRGFDRAAAELFGVGYAPQGWDGLLTHLTGKGFTQDELKLTGMFSVSSNNAGRIYDRFRGRLIWPIRDITGDTVGFGARKLYEEDQGPKYLNTPETSLYRKSQVLYGIDLAKREIAKTRQLVVVEGYTDVMACHLAGVGTAVATCGTAFGADHIKIARRLLSDDGSGGEVVFTFDGDAAGQKAALRAFEEDQRFVAQTYVAVEPSGADPCELRQTKGDDAVRGLISSRRPLFEFAIKASFGNYDLSTGEGQVNALRHAAPIVARIRDVSLRSIYTRELSRWLGMQFVGEDQVARAVATAARKGTGVSSGPGPGSGAASREGTAPSSSAGSSEGTADAAGGEGDAQHFPRPDPKDPIGRMEREVLEVVLQYPNLLEPVHWERFAESGFSERVYGVLKDAVQAAGAAGVDPALWVERVRQEVPEVLRGLVTELAVTPLPSKAEDALALYCRDIVNRLFELRITRLKAEMQGKLQRVDAAADPEQYVQLQRDLLALEMRRRQLRSD
ncbi:MULTISPECIES: DNA primase [unclassified Arthrobacter]|uniref:DNA primase n=1 Tax=unclassified Arthrobacter TaxID=235627 RepID=UPI001490EEC7|nr:MULTISPECIES: DNA primase [unclassified Arthrobacter]MBE0009324.1 DNA primase [Arthrobacter sp. AET 35A]NOJ63159.1 DNA primase [Arthrobacter sp. 147(2020)]